MKWILGFACLIFTGLPLSQAPHFQSRYPRIDSYEIRPGILVTPVSMKGTLCQVSFEQRHVQKDAVHMQSTMPRELVLEIIDELAPPDVRGKPLWQVAGFDYMDSISGSTAVSIANYKNVTVQIYKTRSESGDVATIIEWKHACQPAKEAEPVPR